MLYYYKVESSHWPGTYEFRSEIKMEVGQCFRILSSNGGRGYPTRFKVIEVAETSSYPGQVVTINTADLNVEPF